MTGWKFYRKKKSLKGKILLFLAWGLDEADDWMDILSNRYRNPFGFGYGKRTWEKAVKEFLTVGYIEKKIKNGEVYFRITPQGKINISRDISLVKLRRQGWDGLFRQAIFDIPEEKEKRLNLRSRIRDKLKELGFGMLQESVFISPFDIVGELEDFLEAEKLTAYVKILEARYISGDDPKSLAEKVWKLEEINEKYFEFIEKWEEKLKLPKEEIKKLTHDWQNEFLEILEEDPGLPKELLIDNWLGEKAKEIFKTLEKRA